ncbi:MAG: hypothetical protein WAZ77_16475, partial [Candidatus Nitrosopolaris sp.]
IKYIYLRHIVKSSSYHFDCEICLWAFETNSELDIHNYLEHLTINRVSLSSGIVQDARVTLKELNNNN